MKRLWLLLSLKSSCLCFAATPTEVTIPNQSCSGHALSSPLRHEPKVFSPFSWEKKHYGTDFVSSDQEVISVAPGKIENIGFQEKPLMNVDTRSGLKVKGWGYYVIVRHDDGSSALYAHLKKDSASNLQVGQPIKTGDKIAISDTSGGATGPHLHFEYSPSGQVYGGTGKADPDLCILRKGWITLESFPESAKGVFELFIGDTLVGESTPGAKIRFIVLSKPGKYPIRAIAKKTADSRKAFFSVEMGEQFTILGPDGADQGPGFSEELAQGQKAKAMLLVK